MHRTTVMLPDDLKRRAEERARSEGISLGELVRRSLALVVDTTKVDRRDDPLFADRAVYADEGSVDMAAEHDAHLYGETS